MPVSVNGDPFCGRAYNKSTIALGSILGPLMFGNFHTWSQL